MAKLRIRKSNHAMNRSFGGDLGIYIILAIFGAFMFIPMLYTVIQSLKPLDELWMYPPRFWVQKPTLDNFGDLLKLMGTSWVPFSRYIFNTAFISILGTFGNVIFSSFAAYSLAKIRFPGRKFLFNIVQKSLMFNATVTSITNFLSMSILGLLDSYWAIIIPACATPLGLYLMKQFMETSVPDAVLESARLDGASEWRIFWTLVMPMVKPAWMTLIVFCFKDLWNAGASTYVYSEQLKTFNYAINQIITGGISRQGAGAASTVIMMIVPIAVFVFSQSNVIETMSTSGMKD
ncbi:MAG: carbohydrate ABC transporter permease [Ruminococcaceae bacterium]|nr:carbohydrate ABC transporter permease [Oscillospiraceae bacterium]